MEFTDVARLASGHVEARIIQAALQLGIFDALSSDPKNCNTVAATLSVEPRATELLLNALVALKLLEIGSGPATYPIALCRQFPDLRATIFDLPGTLKVTERYVRDAHMEKQIMLIAGDYRSEAIPGNYDVVLLSNIIHGESDDENG